MTTATYSSVIAHTTDAEFRAWGLELSQKIAEVGMVQTADTGQINWTTVTRPTAGSVGGYEIWRFADSSLYIKIEYGTGSTSATYPGVWLTVGQGSNGAGTLTGTLSARVALGNTSPNTTTTPYPTYLSRTADCFNVVWKLNGGASTSPLFCFAIGKTVDAAGTLDGLGFAVFVTGSGSGNSMQSIRIAAPAVVGNNSSAGWVAVPGDPTSNVIGGVDPQIYPVWSNMPSVRAWPYVFAYCVNDIGKQSTVSVALVGSTPRTYITIGLSASSALVSGLTTGRHGLAFLYE